MTAVRRGRRKKKKTHDDRWDRVGCLGYMLRRDIFVRLIVREECQSLARCTLLVTTHQPPSVDFKHDRGNCAVGDVRDMERESCREDTIKQQRGWGSLFRSGNWTK